VCGSAIVCSHLFIILFATGAMSATHCHAQRRAVRAVRRAAAVRSRPWYVAWLAVRVVCVCVLCVRCNAQAQAVRSAARCKGTRVCRMQIGARQKGGASQRRRTRRKVLSHGTACCPCIGSHAAIRQ